MSYSNALCVQKYNLYSAHKQKDKTTIKNIKNLI